MKKYTLKCVNNGKPFIISNWTVSKHENSLAEMLKNEKGKGKELDDVYRYYVIIQTLREIDGNVTIEDIKKLHPENLIELFNIIYTAGKVDLHFQKPEKGKKK